MRHLDVAPHLRHMKGKVMRFGPPGRPTGEVSRLDVFPVVIWEPACWGVVRPRGPFADQKWRKTFGLRNKVLSHKARCLSDNPKLDSTRPAA